MGDNKKIDNDAEEYYAKYNGLWGETLSRLKNRLVFSRRCNDMLCIYCGEIAQTREHCPPLLNLITSDFASSVFYVPLPAWNVKIFLLRSVFLRQKAG